MWTNVATRKRVECYIRKKGRFFETGKYDKKTFVLGAGHAKLYYCISLMQMCYSTI